MKPVDWLDVPPKLREYVLNDLRDGVKYCEECRDDRTHVYRAAIAYLQAAPNPRTLAQPSTPSG